MFDEQDRKYFFDEFKKNGYQVGSYEDFKKDLSNKEDRDWFYKEAKSMGYDVGSQQDFDKMVLEPTASPSPKQNVEAKAPGERLPDAKVNAATPATQLDSKPSAKTQTAMPQSPQPPTPSPKENEAQSTGIIAGVSGFMPTQVNTSNGTYQPSPSIPQPNVAEARQQEMPQEPDATTGATTQSAASIYSTHFGKDGAISETVADILQRGLANTPEEALEMARNAAYDNATRIALGQTNDIAKRLGDSTEDEERSLNDIYYTHPVQDRIKDDARRNGLSYDDYVKNHLKPAMVESLVSRYGESHRKMAEGVATRLFAHEGDVDNMLEQNDNINDAAALVAKYAAAPVSDAIKKAEAASNTVMGKYNEQSKYVDSASPFAIGALADANKERDPRKILNSLQGSIRNIVKNPHFIGELANLMRSKGYDTKQMDKYVKAYVLPQLQGVFENELNKQEISKIMPRGSFEYILKSGLGNTIVGQVSRKITQTDYQNWLEDMASQQYQPGFWERVASGALTFAGDAWSYWLPGAAGGKVTKAMMAKAEGKLASDLIANGMEKGMAGRAAKVLVGRSKGMALKTGAVHGATTFGGQSLVSTPINEIYKDGQLDENGNAYHTSVGKTLAHTLEEVTKGAVLGSVMQGGTLANLMSKGRGLAANILADVGGKVVDSSIMTGPALLERMAKDPSFKPTGKDAAESFLESMANLTAIGLPGMVGKYARFKDANEFNRKYDFTEDDISELRKRGYDDLRTAFEQMGIKDDSEVQLSPERNDQYTTQYLSLLRDGSVPETTKAKVMAVIEGKRPDSFSPVMDSNVVKGDDGKVYLETYNKDGGVIVRVGYGSEEKAREAERELDYEKSLNLASAYEKAYQMYNFQEQVDDTYNNAADKYANGGALSETDKAAIFLHQKQGDFAKVTQKVARREQLTPEEQKLYEAYSTVYGNLYQNDTSMREYLATFEDSRGLGRGSLRKALEGHSKAEASKLSDDVVYVGNGKYRTKDEVNLVDDYMGQLFNDISYKREMRQTRESMAGRKLEDLEHPQETERTPTAELPGPGTQEAEPSTTENLNPPSNPPTSSEISGTVDGLGASAVSTSESLPSVDAATAPAVSDAFQMGQTAYTSNDTEALKSIDYNDDLSLARLLRVFKGSEDMVDVVRKAYSDGDNLSQFVEERSKSLTPLQRDAIIKYAEAQDAKQGAYDALKHADDGYSDALKEQLWPYATEDGYIMPATLNDGRTVFLKKANEYGGAFVVMPDEQGNPTIKQVSSGEISQVGDPVAFDDYVSQSYKKQQEGRIHDFLSQYEGNGTKPDEKVEIAMEEGDEPMEMIFEGYNSKGEIVLSDGKDFISVNKNEFDEMRTNAKMSHIQAQLDEEEAQRQNDAALQAEADKKQRFADGIVGYGDGKLDYSSRESDPKVVAEYLVDEYGEDHDKLLKLVNGSRDDIKEQLANKRKAAAEYRGWLDTNADIDPKKARKVDDELKLVEEQMEDLDARMDNWNAIRNSVMTPEETKAMRDERKQEISKAGVDEESLVVPENREVPVLSDEELKKQYPTMDEASAYIASQRRSIYKTQSDEVQRQLNDVNDMLEQYVNGDIDLEPGQLKEINTAKALLEARMENLTLSAKELKVQEKKLGRIYKNEMSQKEMENLDMSPSEQRRALVTDALKKNDMNAIHEIYKDSSVDVTDLTPQTLEEAVSDNLYAHSLNAESLASELGNDNFKRGIGKRYDTNKFNYLFAKKGEGLTIGDFCRKVWEDLPPNLEAMGYTDQDVRNTFLDMLKSYGSVKEMRNVALMNRISVAESELSAEEEFYEAQKEREIIVRQKEIEDFKAYIHDKELSLPTESELTHIYGMEYDRMMDIEDREKEYKEYIKQILPELEEYDDRRAEAENAGSGGLDKDSSRRGVVEGSGKGQETLRGEALVESKTGESVDSGRTGRQANSGLERGEGSASGASHLSPEASFGERLKYAIAETETSPSDAQKKAGNYKKGHLSFGGYDFTVETPKGVTRSGKDENGKPWSVTMHDTYGYVLGKIGVDGDHIDMFINDSADLDDFDGNVVVIDQVNPETGEFDEHKVMYGYPDEVTAVNAYMKNYSKDWKGLGKATSVSKATFDKWLQSSDRKTKPFRDYAMIQKEESKKHLQKLPLLDEPVDIMTWMQQHPGQFPDSSDLFGEGQSKKQLGKEVGRQSNTTDKGVVLSKVDYEGGYVLEARYGGDFVKQLYYPNGQLMTRPKFAISGDADSFKKYVHFDEKGVPHVKTSELLDNFMDSVEKHNIDELVRYQNVELEDIPKEYRDFSDEYGVNPENLFMYGESMKYNDSALASRNLIDLRSQYLREHIEDRKAIMDREGVHGLIANRRLFAPVEKAIKEKYGDVDVLIEERKKQVEEERNVMEAARRRAEEEEKKRQEHLEELSIIPDDDLDKRYLDAIGKGDEATAREMLDEAAKRKGYGDTESDYQGVGAWAAPSNPGFETDKERREASESDTIDLNVEDMAAGYTNQPEDIFVHPQRYSQGLPTSAESGRNIQRAIEAIKKGEKDVKVKVYRAVPTSVKEGKLRNGDWVTPSKAYAELHGNGRLEGKYRIIEDEVPASYLWWDSNDVNEWGYDNGSTYKYKNVKNNRKLNDLVTRDDKGNIIPPSMRFNSRKADERYQKVDSITSPAHREVILRDTIINKLRENGIDVIDDVKEGQYVLDHVKGKEKLQAMISNLTKAAKTVKGWLSNNTRNKSFSVELPESTMRLVRNVLGRDFNQHLITANNVAHAKANHGVQGKKLSEKSIPLRDEDFELIPYILTAPTRVQRGSIDVVGRESVRFVKEISNGTILVVEKEQKNSPDGMETITMWAEKSSSNVADALSDKGKSPTIDARNVIISTEDAAKIRKDAETAIINDEKLREQRVFPHSDAGLKFFRTPNGEAYGYTVGGKIYIDPRIANAETPIHEYAHLWSAALRSGNPKEWENIVSLMKGLMSVWEKVKREYPALETDGDIADEVLSQYSGKRGAERLRKEMDDIANGDGDILEKAQAMDALHRLKKVLAKFWKDVCDFLHIHFTSAEEVADRVMKDLLDGIDPRNFLGKNNSTNLDRTLVGVHNISEEKLEKAIKQGGLANPSIAVIDSAKQTHDGYGDISLILPSDEVAKRTGRNAGTWQGDAWTPTYPQVERQMDSKGSVKASEDISSVPTEMQPAVRRGIDRWLDGNNTNSGMAYLFLHERGEEPQLKKNESKYDEKVYNALRFITAGDFNIFGIGEADTKKVLDMYIDARYGGDRTAYEQKTKEWLDKNKAVLEGGKEKGLRYAFAKQDMEMYDEYGFNFKSVQNFVNDVQRDVRNGGKADVDETLKSAENYIKEHNLTDDFSKWIDEKEKQYGVKEVIFDGFTTSGKRKYVANTLENVSKIMKKQGRNGSSGLGFSFNNFAAKLMPSYGKLSEIRSKKGLLTSNHEDLDSFREKWGDVFFELGKKCQPDAENPFDDYGMERLSEAALQKDPQAYLKKEYNVDFSDKDLKRLNEMIKAIKEEYPAMYFETKFERPVGFGEFSAAVVPASAKDEIKKALQDSGVQIFEYDKKTDGDRKRAFDAAINSDSAIRFMFAGVNGAATADMADEKMERMANWNMARQMEKEKLGALPIKMATGWERGIDGKWRYEMPDAKLSEYIDIDGKGTMKKRHEEDMLWTGGKLGDYVDAPEIFKAYPQLKDIDLDTDTMIGGVGPNGEYNHSLKRITIHADNLQTLNRLLNHEIQHAIQYREGFAKGGSPSQFTDGYDAYTTFDQLVKDKFGKADYETLSGIVLEKSPEYADFKKKFGKPWDGFFKNEKANLKYQKESDYMKLYHKFVEEGKKGSAFEQYWRLAGEVEARNVVNRMGLSDEERRKYLAKQTEDVDRVEQTMYGDGVSYSLVENPDTIKKLDKEDTITVYRAMQLGDDGKLYPPMAAKMKGKFVQPIELGKWEQADERPDLADNNGMFTLNKGNGKSLKAAYNPYLHTSYTPLNDQFSEAQNRPNIVTVEVQVPKSELTSGYKAEKAKDAVGELEWKAGVVQGQLTGKRKVVLSRWDKPVRIVPDSEVADVIVNDMFKDKNITMPSNVVTPSLRKELEKRGVPFVETDNRGRIIGGENDGVHYSKVYNIRKPSKVKKAFGVPYDYVKYPLGKVEPDLANKEVEIVPADANHGFKNYKEAKVWAKENISKVYDNDETGEKGIVRISNGAIDKFLSQSAIDKSDTKDVHLSVLKVLPEVLKNSIEAEVHPDFFKGKDGKRVSANGFNKDVLVHRCYGAVDIDGKLYRVKITLKEDLRDSEFPHVTHSYEATKIELLAGTWENPITSPSPNTNNSIVGANLLKNVEMSYAKGKKLLDESEKNDFSSNNLPETIDKVQNTAKQLGGAEASVYISLDEVPEEYREQVLQGARGWYDPSTHTVHVYLPNCSDGNEAQRTVFHEKVGHEGLEVLLGGENGVRKFADFVYKSVGKEMRGKILGFANKYDPQWQNSDRLNVGTQEYIAHLAEDGPATAEEFSLWTKMKHYLIRLLKKLGIRVPGLLNDKDLRYYLMKAGKALHVWDEMPKEKQEAMMSQASNAEIKDALGEGDMKGKPRQKKGESTIQYMKRVREWRKWKEAREDMEDPEPPQFYDLEKDVEGKKEWDRLNKEWRDRHSLVGDDMPTMPKREDGEGDESFFPRYKEYEKWQNALKDADDPMPDMFAWEKQKQVEATRKYEDWLVRHDLAEQEQADLDLYEGKIYPAEVSPEAADLDRKVMQDLAEVTSTDVSKEGASLKVKHAVIHRRKNMEEASADDAIYIGDIKRSIEKIADGGLYDKLLSSYSGKKTKAERLAEAIPYLIEAPRRLRDITHAMNATGAFEKNHLHIQPGDVEAVQPYLGDLRHLTAKVHYELKDGKEVMVYDEPKAVTEIASKIAQAINANHSLEEGFVPVDSTDILNKNVLPVIGKKIVPSGIDYHDLSVEMKSTLDAIRDWYNYTYDWLKDNHTLKDDTGFNRDYVNHLWDKENSDPSAYAMYVENRQRTKSPNEKPRTISTLMEGLDVGLAPKTTDITKMMAYYSRSNIEAWANKTMLQEVSGINVVERNEEGEIISCDPLLSSTPPFNLEQYKYFEIPGIGPVWVYNVSPKYHTVKNPLTGKDKVLYSEASAGERFGVVFDTYQSNKFWKTMDTIASTMKKLELGFSGFHAGALTEVYMVQNMIEFGPKKAFANFMKYIFIDTAKNHSLPCFANPEDFQEAATHLVKFGATNDYAAADVQNMYDNLHDGIRKIHQRLSEAGVVGKTVGVAVTPLEIATQMVSFINKGMDVALWDFLHDGLKLATYKMRSDRTKERAKKQGWTAEQLSKQLDEDGQFVNDMFGGQHWDVLGTSHRTLKYAGRILLSPDWNVSTTRHFLAMTGYGSLWNEASFDSFGQYYKRTWSAAKGKERMSPEDWGRFSRLKSALLCYGIGVMVAYECFANALNAAFRALDEEKEQEKADEIRKTNPSYKSSYELAYPDGMKWYDYLMRGNSLGQQSKIFLGRYHDGSEMYIRHGKQFREIPEYFLNSKGEFEFPGPMVQRLIGKANPLSKMILLDNPNYLIGFQSSHADQELQRKFGKTIGLLYKDALYFAPFLIPSQENKEFKFVDFFFPSAKGFSKWKAQDYFKTFILCGDMRGVALTYQSCQRNGIDPEEQIKAAIGSVKALESAEMQDGVTSLQIASQRFDEAKSITEKKKMRQKMKKFLSEGDYKVFTQKEALDMVQDYLNGNDDAKDMEKTENKYLMKATAKDVTEDWRVQNVMNGTSDVYQEYRRLKGVDSAKAKAFAESRSNKRLLDARNEISKARKKMSKCKKEMSASNDAQKMKEIRKIRKELLANLGKM